MVTAALLSSYSMNIENTVYGSAIHLQGDGSTGKVQNSTLVTLGCSSEYGYDPDSPNPTCVPLDGSEKPEGFVSCASLGCPYNPPNPHAGQP